MHLPFILDPIGSPPLLMRTQALSAKLTMLPSLRWYPLRVRTTTACRTSPLLTLLAALTETGAAWTRLGTKVALLLHHDDDAITWMTE